MLAGMESMNDADLSAVVEQYNNLQEAQGNTATSVADLETEFAEKMGEIQTEMESMVDGMDLSDEAKTNAKSTMDAYVSEIESGIAKAQSAIDSLSFANSTLSGGGYHAYATGTLDAEPGLALVGEEGPELVNFGGGEVVYTSDETADILAGSADDSNNFYVAPAEGDSDVSVSEDKTITLRIEGAGEMKVGGNGVSKEDIVNVLMDNVKDALMGIIQQEIIEEGDMAYEF
jgi:SLT domain-containing protein